MTAVDAAAPRRGTYANGERTRAALVDAAFEVFAEKGIERLSIRQLAEAIGTSHTALLHHFGSKDALLEAVMARREERDGPERERLLRDRGFLDAVPAIMELNAGVPGLIRLDTRLRVEGLDSDNPAHEFTTRRQDDFYASVISELEAEDAAGHLRAGLDLPVVAQLITSLVAGIQIAWLADPDVDMGAHLEAFMALIRA